MKKHIKHSKCLNQQFIQIFNKKVIVCDWPRQIYVLCVLSYLQQVLALRPAEWSLSSPLDDVLSRGCSVLVFIDNFHSS